MITAEFLPVSRVKEMRSLWMLPVWIAAVVVVVPLEKVPPVMERVAVRLAGAPSTTWMMKASVVSVSTIVGVIVRMKGENTRFPMSSLPLLKLRSTLMREVRPAKNPSGTLTNSLSDRFKVCILLGIPSGNVVKVLVLKLSVSRAFRLAKEFGSRVKELSLRFRVVRVFRLAKGLGSKLVSPLPLSTRVSRAVSSERMLRSRLFRELKVRSREVRLGRLLNMSEGREGREL